MCSPRYHLCASTLLLPDWRLGEGFGGFEDSAHVGAIGLALEPLAWVWGLGCRVQRLMFSVDAECSVFTFHCSVFSIECQSEEIRLIG